MPRYEQMGKFRARGYRAPYTESGRGGGGKVGDVGLGPARGNLEAILDGI